MALSGELPPFSHGPHRLASDMESACDTALGNVLTQSAQNECLALGRHGLALGIAGKGAFAAVTTAAGRPRAVSAELDDVAAGAMGAEKGGSCLYLRNNAPKSIAKKG